MSPFTTAAAAAVRTVYTTRRPWSQFLDPTSLTCPPTLANLTKNLTFFAFNYTSLILLIVSLTLLSHSLLCFLIFLVLLSLWFFLFLSRDPDDPFTCFGVTVEDGWVLVALVIVTVVGVWGSGGLGSLVIGVVVGGAVGCLHGCMRGIEDLGGEGEDSTAYGALLPDVV